MIKRGNNGESGGNGAKSNAKWQSRGRVSGGREWWGSELEGEWMLVRKERRAGE